MSPAGKIINIDAFKKKQSGLDSGKMGVPVAAGEARQRLLRLLGVLGAVVIVMTYMMAPSGKKSVPVMSVGSISPYNIKAQSEALIEDEESTEKSRALAAENTPDVFDFDHKVAEDVNTRIAAAFKLMSQAYSDNIGASNYSLVVSQFGDDQDNSEVAYFADGASSQRAKEALAAANVAVIAFEREDAFKKSEAAFASTLGMELNKKLQKTLRYYHYWPEIGDHITSLLRPMFEAGIVGQKSFLKSSGQRGIIIRDISSDNERVTRDFNAIIDIPNVYRMVKREADQVLSPDRPGLKRMIARISAGLAAPNLTFSRKETETRRELAFAAVEPVFFRVQRGEMIVREGDRVTKAHAVKLASLANSSSDAGLFQVILGSAIFNILIVTLLALFIWKYHPEVYESEKMHWLIAVLLVSHTALTLAAASVFTMFLSQTPEISLRAYLLAAPLTFAPMIISIFFTTELTVLFTIAVTAVTGFVFRDYPVLALMALAGGMVCAFHVRHYSKRSAVIKVGILISCVNVVVALSSGFVSEGFWLQGRAYEVGFALFGGALAAILVSAALPLIESLSPVVSDIKLLELTNLNHPLLRRMIMESPGTYHHSIMVGNLAEEACKSIGANALLARAGALFHDIGKMKKPSYFVENQRHGVNPHDKLTPNMSALIVINHIKQGQELAKQHKLLPQVAAMIPEHHGTQLVRVFYHNAKTSEDMAKGPVREEDFRYPGPIPGSPESAIVALSDSIEASARACLEPTIQQLKQLVTEVINDKFIQGQLDHSQLTLHDLAVITESFVHVLSGIHHHRLQYPEQEKGQAQNNSNDSSDSDKTKISEAESV